LSPPPRRRFTRPRPPRPISWISPCSLQGKATFGGGLTMIARSRSRSSISITG
jgi:hypothetical protein